MSKRKILMLAMALCMVAILAVGGTLAYFVDTETATNTFTVGKVDIQLNEYNADGSAFTNDQVLMPGSKTENEIAKIVKVKNTGKNDAYVWIEVWIPSALDDGDDHSPQAPGLGNSLHFNYPENVTETKATYLGSKEINGVSYNGYVHYIAGATEGIAPNTESDALLTQVYMDKDVTQCTEHENCMKLIDKDQTCYTGAWTLIINAVGFQSEGVATIEAAITEYYGVDVTAHIW